MELPIEVYTELAQRHGAVLLGAEGKTSAPGLRVLPEDAAVPSDGFVYVKSPPPELINEAMETTAALSEWLIRLDNAVEAGASPQELVDMSEGVLGEPVLAADPSMKRLAATSGVLTADTFFCELSKQGYPSPETYDRLDRAQYYDHRFYTGGVMRLATQETPSLDVALRAIRLDGRLVATMLMLFQTRPWSEGHARLFSLLTDRVAACLEKGSAQSAMRSRQYEFLLRDLLDSKKLSDDEIQARLAYTDYPRQDVCHAVVFSAGEGQSAKLSYIARVLEGVFRYSRPIIYENLVFTTLPARDGRNNEALAELERFCAETGSFCGVSNRMERLAHLRAGYEQARDALDIGRRLIREGTWFSLGGPAELSRVFYHETFAPYRAILVFSRGREAGDLCCQSLKKLLEADAKNGTDNALVLYHYLCCHLNYTETAKRLFMHRNSVIYRVSRICEFLGVESITRQAEAELLFSYMVLDMAQRPG